METKESVQVLKECIELQLKKSQDYQNPNSNVKQSMHYRRGVDTIHDIMHGKMLRAQSLLEAAASNSSPNFESLEDTYKDLINYASFAVSYIRGKMEGQDPDRNMFNKKVVTVSTESSNVSITTDYRKQSDYLDTNPTRSSYDIHWAVEDTNTKDTKSHKFGYFDQ